MRIERGKVKLPSDDKLAHARTQVADALSEVVEDPERRKAIARGVVLRAIIMTSKKWDHVGASRENVKYHQSIIAAIDLISAHVIENSEPFYDEGRYITDHAYVDLHQKLSEPFKELRYLATRAVELSEEFLSFHEANRKRERDPLHQCLDVLADQWSELGGAVSAASGFRKFAEFGTLPLWGEKTFPVSALTSAISRFNERRDRKVGRGNPSFRLKKN